MHYAQHTTLYTYTHRCIIILVNNKCSRHWTMRCSCGNPSPLKCTRMHVSYYLSCCTNPLTMYQSQYTAYSNSVYTYRPCIHAQESHNTVS
ncbi:hypothetical protein GBAR_LOCUS8115 [Geodia barretti]|uniref:Uncharacterized protein n=1 Tax=Geodia barretti TaxID=519541 RepID=A0AA35W9T4_GEOBA|nr:hypothetical protein GBAR_LOCUS8115 [Geodia barretti]